MYTLLHKALNEKVTIVVNEKRRRITKIEAAFWQLANGAAGKLRHVQLMMHFLPLLGQRAQKMTRREAPKLTEMSRAEFSREVLRILRACGEFRDSDLPAPEPVRVARSKATGHHLSVAYDGLAKSPYSLADDRQSGLDYLSTRLFPSSKVERPEQLFRFVER